MAKSRRSPSLVRKARKMSSGKLFIIGIILAALAYALASSTTSFNPSSLLAAVSGYSTTTPALRVVSPNGGETWAKGSTRTITWTGGTPDWRLEVLLKNASTTNTVVTIATSTANTGSISWVVPTTVKARTYNIRIRCTNCPTGTKGVTDLSDKPFTITDVAALPDLTATSVLPTAAIVGTTTRLITTTTNIGTASTGAGFAVTFQSATSPAGSAATTIGSISTTALAAGSSRQISLYYTFSTAGTYYVRACADKTATMANGPVVESNENNNCGSYTAVVVAGVTPDLTANSTRLSASTTPRGQTITFSGSINNVGSAATNIPSIFRVLSPSGYQVFALLPAGTTASIATGASNIPVTSINYSTMELGTYTVDLCANTTTGNVFGTVPANAIEPIAVATYASNCGPKSTFTVTTGNTPDLIANNLNVLHSAQAASETTGPFYPGESIFMYGSISNIGTAATNIPSVFRVRNQAGTKTYARISAGTLSSIAAGALGMSITPAVYSTTTPGTFLIDLCANMNTTGKVPANTSEASSVASNNCGAPQTITVTQ